MNPAAAGGGGGLRRINRWLSPGARLEEATDERVCARCLYAFPGGTAGAPRTCTECGAPLDPTVVGTLVAPGPSASARWFMHAPGIWHQLAVLGACALLFIGDMAPGGWFTTLVIGALALLGLGAFGAARIIVATVLAMRCGRLRAVDSQPGWWLPPTMVIVLMLLLGLGVPRWAGFRIQRPRLDAARAAWEALPPDQRARGVPGNVMLWTPSGLRDAQPAYGLRYHGPGVAVAVPSTGVLFDMGMYAYLPEIGADEARSHGLRALGDGWYEGTFDAMD